jgi:hypothetical protein
MIVLYVLLAVVAALLVALLLCDRVLAELAERKASAYVTAPLGHGARVRVHGEPFLTQALRGRYREVEVTASDVQLGSFAGVWLQAHLINALLPLQNLLGGRADELPVEHVHAQLVFPYEELARVSRVPGLRFTFRDERLIATASLPIPGFGQLAQVSGEAVATISEGGGIWLRVRNVAVAGISVPSVVLNQLIPALAFPVPLPPLPYGLRLEALTPTPEGLQLYGSAHAVVFRAR